MISADSNAYHVLWGSKENNTRGRARETIAGARLPAPRRRRLSQQSAESHGSQKRTAARALNLDLNQSNTSDTKSKTKVKKVFANRKQLVDSLSKAFINTTLKTILNFIRTESEASLVFRNADKKQLSFIQSACAMARSPKFYTLFADDSRQILREISKVITENQWYELRVDVAKAQKDKLRTVSLVKYPKDSYDEKRNSNKPITFESGGKLEQVVGGIVGGILTVNKENQPLKSTDIETKIQSNENNSNRKEPQIIKEDNNNIQNSDKENIVPTNETKIKNINVSKVKSQTRPSRADYKDQSLSDMKRAKSVPPSLIKRDKKVEEILGGRKLCLSKLKMLQAMSKPMESDIATRMMNQMGWDGGPLGLRGEGITEPIIPPLHLAPKAGLGHVKPDKKSNSIFRHNFLQQLLTLLTKEQSKLIVEFKTPITDQENKYITNTTKLLNDRKNISEKNEEEIKNVVFGIMEELLCEPDLEISFEISSDKKYVTLIKNITTFKKKTIPATVDRDAIVMQMCSNLPEIITTDCAKSIGILYMKTSGALKMGVRLILQYKVMEFLKSNLMEYTIESNFDFSKKSVNCLKNTMSIINERKKEEMFSTSIEREINTETLRHAKGIQIDVETDKLRFLTLRKKIVKQLPNSEEPSDLANNNSDNVNKNIVIETKTKQESNSKQESKTIQVSNATQEPKIKQESIAKEETKTKQKSIAKEESNTKQESNPIQKSKTKQESNTKKESKTKQKSNITQEASKTASNITDDMKNCTANSTDTVDYIVISDDENEAKSNSFELKEMEQEIQSIENLSPSIKRNRSDSVSSYNIIKKTKMTEPVTYFFITPKEGDKISNDEVRKFQTAVAEQIDLAMNLPMLECHGVENGAIVYGCHNDIGAKLIKSIASEMRFTTKECENFAEKGCRKLNIRLNSFVGVNLKKLFNLIECYNIGLNTDRWVVEDVEVFKDYIILSVEVDYASFQYILEANFRLFAGTDRLRISLVWE